MPFAKPFRIVLNTPEEFDIPLADLVLADAWTLPYAQILMSRLAADMQSDSLLDIVNESGQSVVPRVIVPQSIDLATVPF